MKFHSNSIYLVGYLTPAANTTYAIRSFELGVDVGIFDEIESYVMRATIREYPSTNINFAHFPLRTYSARRIHAKGEKKKNFNIFGRRTFRGEIPNWISHSFRMHPIWKVASTTENSMHFVTAPVTSHVNLLPKNWKNKSKYKHSGHQIWINTWTYLEMRSKAVKINSNLVWTLASHFNMRLHWTQRSEMGPDRIETKRCLFELEMENRSNVQLNFLCIEWFTTLGCRAPFSFAHYKKWNNKNSQRNGILFTFLDLFSTSLNYVFGIWFRRSAPNRYYGINPTENQLLKLAKIRDWFTCDAEATRIDSPDIKCCSFVHCLANWIAS